MKLKDLLVVLENPVIVGSTDVDVVDVCVNSTHVKPGSVFVAVSGLKSNGRQYVPDAVKRGAVAVILEDEFFDNLGITQIRVKGARVALACLSAQLFVHPTKQLYINGVTGTNGKTTLTHLVRSIWQESNISSGLIGTVGISYGTNSLEAMHTTPESRDLQELFRKMVDEQIRNVSMEVSSHAIVQKRVDNIHFNSCVFTNLTQDHLDYHQTLDEYFKAKQALFTELLVSSEKLNKLAIICQQSEYANVLIDSLNKNTLPFWTYGLDSKSTIYPVNYKITLEGIQAKIHSPSGLIELQSPLMGDFNLLNLMGALAVCLHSGISPTKIQDALRVSMGAKGRLERIVDPLGRLIFVDYAHTPDALTNVLKTIKALEPKKIITVFGCGGDRDKTKRPLMGFESARFSDICIITSDNPRTESPTGIINDIIPGVARAGMSTYKAGKGYFVVEDRKSALKQAVDLAEAGDVILVAGKGHEDYQIIGTQKSHFSDQEELQKLL